MKINARIVATFTIVVLLHLLVVFGQAQSGKGMIVRQRIHTYGCLSGITEDEESEGLKVFVSSGWKTLDDSLLKDIRELDKQFGVNVSIYFVKSDTQNAFFTNQQFSDLIRGDGGNPNVRITGSVFVFSGLLTKEFQNGGYAIPAFIAHEFAHAAQYANSFPFSGKWKELHADYMAGWFTAHRQRFFLQDANQAQRSLFALGDYGFFEEDHHGTPQERAQAFYAGYILNRANVAAGSLAYGHGLNYVKASGAR